MRNEKMTQFQKEKKTFNEENKTTLSLYEKEIEYGKFLQDKKNIQFDEQKKNSDKNFSHKFLPSITSEKGHFLLNFLRLTPTLELEFFNLPKQKPRRR